MFFYLNGKRIVYWLKFVVSKILLQTFKLTVIKVKTLYNAYISTTGNK